MAIRPWAPSRTPGLTGSGSKRWTPMWNRRNCGCSTPSGRPWMPTARRSPTCSTRTPWWPAIADALDKADAEFAAACAAQGLSPEEVARVQEIDRALRAKEAELEGKQRKLNDLAAELAPLDDRYEALLDVWRNQHRLREEAAGLANGISASLQQRFMEVTVHCFGDHRAFDAIWERLAPRDGRTTLARQWKVLGDALFDEARAAKADGCGSMVGSG